MECPDCKGKGKILLLVTAEDPCRTCEGTGEVPDKCASERSEKRRRARTCEEYKGWSYGGFCPPWPPSVD